MSDDRQKARSAERSDSGEVPTDLIKQAIFDHLRITVVPGKYSTKIKLQWQDGWYKETIAVASVHPSQIEEN